MFGLILCAVDFQLCVLMKWELFTEQMAKGTPDNYSVFFFHTGGGVLHPNMLAGLSGLATAQKHCDKEMGNT